MFLMFANQFASQITTLIFVLINDFCDFDHCYFPDCNGGGGPLLFIYCQRNSKKSNKTAEVLEDLLKYKIS